MIIDFINFLAIYLENYNLTEFKCSFFITLLYKINLYKKIY